MTDTTWEFGPSSGTITIHTDVAGRAAKAGHRLTIEMERWSGTATSRGDEPVGVQVTVAVDSLSVHSGEGGLTPLSGPEKLVARSNAFKSLQPDKYPDITFESSSIATTSDGYRADGTLTIHGKSRPHALEFRAADTGSGWSITAETTITQTEFGIKPFSLMMGTLKVADDVRVDVDITVAK